MVSLLRRIHGGQGSAVLVVNECILAANGSFTARNALAAKLQQVFLDYFTPH